MARSVIAILMLAAFSSAIGVSKIQSTPRPHTTVEIRLAEGRTAPGLTEAEVTGSGTRVYLHREVLMTARDILRCDFSDTYISDTPPGRFFIGLALADDAADRMADPTSGQELALLVDGRVIALSVSNIRRYFRPYCAFDVSSKEEAQKVARVIRTAVIESLIDARGRLTLEIRLGRREPEPGKDLIKSVESVTQQHVYLLQTPPIVSNADIVDAKVVSGYIDGIFNVQLTLTDEAAQRFQQWSEAHMGEMLAEMIGGRVVSAPYIVGKLPAQPPNQRRLYQGAGGIDRRRAQQEVSYPCAPAR
jgi:preprotein translocase subunit SecD